MMRRFGLLLATALLWGLSFALWLPLLRAFRHGAEAVSSSLNYALLLVALPAAAMLGTLLVVWQRWRRG